MKSSICEKQDKAVEKLKEVTVQYTADELKKQGLKTTMELCGDLENWREWMRTLRMGIEDVYEAYKLAGFHEAGRIFATAAGLDVDGKISVEKIESLLLRLLNADDVFKDDHKLLGELPDQVVLRGDRTTTYTLEGMTGLTADPAEAPLVVMSDDRLFTTHPEDLLRPVHELIGDRVESVFRGNLKVKVTVITRQARRSMANFNLRCPLDSIPYKVTYRELDWVTGKPVACEVFPVMWSPSLRTGVKIFRKRSEWKRNSKRDGGVDQTSKMVLQASLVEDASYFWNVRVRQGSHPGITFYGNNQPVRELCDLRDNPLTASGRRRPIIHKVAEHVRRVGARERLVSEHLRGVTAFELEGYNFNVTRCDGTEVGCAGAKQA